MNELAHPSQNNDQDQAPAYCLKLLPNDTGTSSKHQVAQESNAEESGKQSKEDAAEELDFRHKNFLCHWPDAGSGKVVLPSGTVPGTLNFSGK
jgi:hypothetical protein